MKKIITITGIRPDFIRMSEVFNKLDQQSEHVCVHTGQHFDFNLSDVFFDELNIRKPDYNLHIGGENKKHYHQSADLSVKIIDLIYEQNLKPDWIVFLGDSNSVTAAVPLKKEGFKIAHIEAGMRSYDDRMLEEINRKVCDHCSDHLYVYHNDYKNNLLREGVNETKISVVGNTITEVCKTLSHSLFLTKKRKSHILMDIHRPENFKYKDRMQNIINYANELHEEFKLPVRMVGFKRTLQALKEFKLYTGDVIIEDLMSFKQYLSEQYHAFCIFSDSGTAQEEPALLKTPVIVPRDYTERPQSMLNQCSRMINVNNRNDSWEQSMEWVHWINKNTELIDTSWLGNGNTAELIVDSLTKS